MSKKNICVVFGGCSSEYLVSLHSAYSVIKNLKDEKYQKTLVGITKEGNWYLYEGDIDLIPEDKWEGENCRRAFLSPSRSDKGIYVENNGDFEFLNVDLMFPVLHGINGEDGTIQGLIQMAGIPLIGCGMEASVICMDKDLGHILAEKAGVRVAKSMTAKINDDRSEIIDRVKPLGFPMFVKPIKAGSSFGISKVHDESELMPAIEEAFEYDKTIIFEEFIDGIEVGCAVFGKDHVKVSPVDEIELFVDWFSYEEKYTQTKSNIHLPARLSFKVFEEVRQTAEIVYKALGCDSFARVDIFITKDDQLVFNEINTIPGMTSHSRFPKMVGAMGIEYSDFLDMMVDLALENEDVK